jgi:hypothetical protein
MAGARRVTRNATSLHTLQTLLHQPPSRIAKKQSDGRFPALAIRRLGVGASGYIGEFVLTDRDNRQGRAVAL